MVLVLVALMAIVIDVWTGKHYGDQQQAIENKRELRVNRLEDELAMLTKQMDDETKWKRQELLRIDEMVAATTRPKPTTLPTIQPTTGQTITQTSSETTSKTTVSK